MKTKLVIIASRFPYPLEKGDKLRLYYQIKSLAQTCDIYLLSLSDVAVAKTSLVELEKYCQEIHVYRIHGKKNATKGLLNGKPFQVNYFYSRKIHSAMQKELERIFPDHIYYQLIRTTEYSFDKKYKRSVDMMDCFSKGYHLRGFKENGFRKKFYDIEAKRLKLYEGKVMQDFALKFVISEQDKAELQRGAKGSLQVLSNGIDTNYFSPKAENKEYDIVFVGNMGYEPNIYAARYLLNELVSSMSKDIKVLIAGARPPASLKAKTNAQIHVSGWMEDIRDAYNKSKVFLAPIADGIGQQNKILEAMAMELPCIVSKEVALGLDIENIQDFLFVAETKEQYLSCFNKILMNSDAAKERAQKARRYIVENRSWDAVNSILSSALLE